MTEEERKKYTERYFEFLHNRMADCMGRKFSTSEDANKCLYNYAYGMFDLILTNTNHNLFERDNEWEKHKFKEIYISLEKYVYEIKTTTYFDLENEGGYNFLYGIDSFLHGLLDITHTKESYLDASGYEIAYAGDCMEYIFEQLGTML